VTVTALVGATSPLKAKSKVLNDVGNKVKLNVEIELEMLGLKIMAGISLP